ncbi:hypothetical protein TNCV_3138741 [Trichonephila clavipes]|nr:hypothetical protein TNCV_3138741 [Trichonephila clavipes]
MIHHSVQNKGPNGFAHITIGVLPQNWGGNEPKRTVTCMVLKAIVNDRRPLALCHDEFRPLPIRQHQ